MMNPFEQAAQLDRAMIVAYEMGHDLRIYQPPLWHDPKHMTVPTFVGALAIAHKFGVEIESCETSTHPVRDDLMGFDLEPTIEYRSLVRVTGGCMVCAGQSRDRLWGKQIAEGLAFRGAMHKWYNMPHDRRQKEAMRLTIEDLASRNAFDAVRMI